MYNGIDAKNGAVIFNDMWVGYSTVLCVLTSLTIVDVKVSVTLQLQELAYKSIAF